MENIWTNSNGTLVCEISTLEAYGLCKNGLVSIGERDLFDLRESQADVHNDEVAGWKFTFNGQKYLVIND